MVDDSADLHGPTWPKQTPKATRARRAELTMMRCRTQAIYLRIGVTLDYRLH